MLRVFKPQSPMSMGAWTLSAFSSFSGAAAFANLMRERMGPSIAISLVENASGLLAAATGLVMSSYTGVLIGATVIPVWNENVGTLPQHFAASGLNSAVSLLEVLGHDDSRALNLLGIGASAYEVYEGFELETKRDRVNEPLHKGWSGAIVRAGGVLSGPVPLASASCLCSERQQEASSRSRMVKHCRFPAHTFWLGARRSSFGERSSHSAGAAGRHGRS